MARQARAKAKPEGSEKYERRRREVLQAAARTFNRLGFHIATLDDVAGELGVTKPALYYYAKSKDELLFACGDLALEELTKALDKSAAPDLSGRDRLARFFHLYTEIICEDFGLCLVLTEPRDLAPETRKSNLRGRRGLNLAVREIIQEGIRDGSINACDDRVLAMVLFDAFNGIGRWYAPNGPLPLSNIIDQYLAIFLNGLAADRPSS